MDIKLEEFGESFYNPMLAPMVDKLIKEGVATESEGAIVIEIPKIGNKKNKVPLMIRKSDGGYMYGTTDMAALNHRVNDVKADRIIYVTDAGQELHFKLLFEGGKLANFYDPEKTKLNHVQFGVVQSKDENGKVCKFKTRSGDTVKLVDVLDESKERAMQVFEARMAE